MWLKAPNITCPHGFSTRHGGVSPSPFDSLNLGGSEDSYANIAVNRQRALNALSLDPTRLCTLKQIHGNKVCEAITTEKLEGDALVSNKPGTVIGVLVADCYPVLFYDAVKRVIGAAHCGWRGTVARLAAKTLEAMEAKGADKRNIHAAIGQGISAAKFEVGNEVIAQFRQAGFPEYCLYEKNIDLVRSILFTLTSAGLPPENIWTMNRCTFEADFFSHRRDKGRTGRMMGVIGLPTE